MTANTPDKASTRSTKISTWFKLHWKGLLFTVLGIVTFLALFIFVSHSPIPVGAVPATTVAMLAIITATAVGIERAIETFWSLVGQLAHAWWPFNKMFNEVTALEQDVKTRIQEAQDAIDKALSTAGNVVDDTTDRLGKAREEIDKLKGRISELEKLAPGNQRVSLIAASVNQGMGMVAQYQPRVEYNLQLIDQSVAGLTDFAASFKENPLRRIINIWAGAMIGLVVAYFVRFDVFYAVLGEASKPANWWPNLGVALTGLIVGLGSNPTHDVIAALQEVKKFRASQNQPGPFISGAAVGGAGAPAPEFEAAPGYGAAPEYEAYQAPARPAPPVRRFR